MKRALAVCLLISVSIAALWVWGFNTHYFTRRDAYDYAQISLQFFQGKGLATLQIFPRHIPYFQDNGILNGSTWPNLYRNPLLMILNFAFLRFFDSVIVASVIQSGFWYIVSIPVLFFLANRLTNLRVAIVSTIFYAADPVIFLYGYSGMTETLATFLLLCLLFVFTWDDEKRWKWLLAGSAHRSDIFSPNTVCYFGPFSVNLCLAYHLKTQEVFSFFIIISRSAYCAYSMDGA